MPVAEASQEDLVRKKAAFESMSFLSFLSRGTVHGANSVPLIDWLGTTHWPNARHTGSNSAKRDGEPDKIERNKPLNEPKLSERAFKLTGIPYIKV